MTEDTYNPPYNHWSGNKSDTLNKWKINYKGSIATASALPVKGEFKGDTYNVLEDGSNYMWNGTSWDKLDANAYVGATNNKSGTQGLVPPASSSQIHSLLTGGGTWESAEDLGLALNNEVIHSTSNETIEGVKTFQNTSPGHVEGDTVTDLVIRNPKVTRGTLLESGDSYTSIIFADAEGDTEETFAGRLGVLSILSPKENGTLGTQLSLRCYKFTDVAEQLGWNVALTVGYDTDGIPYASAPPTSALRSDDKDILTRNWIPKDTRIVHTTGAETVAGNKTFTGALRLGSSSIGGIVCSADSANDAMEVDVYGASEYSNGAVLRVFGKSHQYNPGYFICRAAIDSSTAKQLSGRPDGTLTWDGQAIQTSSDERLKTPLFSVPDAVLDAWGDVQWGQFRYLEAVRQKGEVARLHLGLIAQKVKTVFEKRGLDACAYGILCHDFREATEEEPATDLWTVRYAEALAMEAAFQRRRADRLEERIAALERHLNLN